MARINKLLNFGLKQTAIRRSTGISVVEFVNSRTKIKWYVLIASLKVRIYFLKTNALLPILKSYIFFLN